MANQGYTVKFTGQFDTSQVTKGLQDIKKQISNANISDELKKQFEAAFNKLQVKIPALEKLTSKEDFNLKDIEALQKLLKEVTKDWENLNKVTNQIDLSKTFSAKDLEKINNLDKQIKDTQDNIQKARKELIDSFTKDYTISTDSKNISDALTELFTVNPNEIESKFKEIQEQFTQGIQQTQVELKNKLEHAKIVKTREDVIGYFFGKDSGVEFAGKSGPIVAQINEITKAYRGFKQANDEAGMAEQIQKLNQVLTNTANFKFQEGYKLFGLPTQEDLTILNNVGAKLGELKALAETKEEFFTEEEAKALDLINQKIDVETKAALEAKNANDQLHESTKTVGGGFQDLSNKTEDTAEQQRKLKAQSEALSATFGSLAHRITNSISALTVFNKSIQIVHKAIASVKELDAAFTQIAIVSEKSNEEAWQMFDSFNKLAKQYSITTKDLTEGAKLFYQQGLNAADTMKMVEASTVSAALGEVTMTEAANTLTAAIQGYNESAAVAMDYTDKIAKVGAVSAADFNELSAAMEKTASSAYTAGIDFDHLLGFLGRMIEVTREAPANLGTAMKTIIARFEDMKKDPMAILEDGVSANKVETALASIGIALRNTAGEFRPLQDVMVELGSKWDSLTRNQQAYIATVAAGSRQQSRFLAMMNDFDRTLELINESQNSAGAAAEQYAIYQDSAAAATARLTAAWEEFYSKIVNSEQIIWVINALEKLVETMSKIGPVGTGIIATLGTLTLNKVISSNLIGNFVSSFFTVSGPKIVDGIVKTGSYGMKEALSIGVQKWIADKTGAEVLKNGMSTEIASAVSSGIGKGFKDGLKGLGKVTGEIAIIIAMIMGAKAIIDFITNKNEENTKQYERQLKAQSEISKKFIEEHDNIKEQKNIVKDNLKIYEQYENRIILSNEELEESNNAVEKLQENNSKLIVITDELGKKQILNKEILEQQTKELELQEKVTNQIIAANKLKAVQVPKGGNLQDLSVEQLTNSGYTQDEAELLDQYGELFRTRRDNNESGFFLKEWFLKMTQNNPMENLGGDILKEMRKNNIYGIVGLNPYNIADTLQNGDLKSISQLIEQVKENLRLSDNEQLDNVLNYILEKAEIAKDGLQLLDAQTQKYVNNLAGINLNTGDSLIQNDLMNMINNIDKYGDTELFDIPADVTDPDDIAKIVNKQVDAWNEAIQNIKASDKQPFHNFIKNLLDPNLSQSERNELINNFATQYADLYSNFEDLILHYSQGTEREIEIRKQLTDKLGMNLDNYSMSDLNLIDHLVDNSDAETVAEGLKQPWAESYIKALSGFKKDVIENPAIYKPVHDATVKMWQESFGLKEEDAIALFEDMYGSFPEIALSAAKEGFAKAKDTLSMGPTESLSDDQYTELENILGNSLGYYIEINEEGERYLTVAGRIALLEKQRQNYAEALLGKINDNTQKAEDIKKVNDNLTDEQLRQINNYERENKLLAKQLKTLEDIEGLSGRTATARSNISYAEGYYKNLDVIKQAQEEMVKLNGQINKSTADTIMSMSDEYIKYLNIRETGEGAIYELTAENAEAIRQIETDNYNHFLETERGRIQNKINDLDVEIEYFTSILNDEAYFQDEANRKEYEEHVKALNNKLTSEEESSEKTLDNQQKEQNASLAGMAQYGDKFNLQYGQMIDEAGNKWNSLFRAMGGTGEQPYEYDSNAVIAKPIPIQTMTIQPIVKQEPIKEVDEDGNPVDEDDYTQEWAQKYLKRAQEAKARLEARLAQLKILAPDLEIPSGAGKSAEDYAKQLEAVSKAAEEAADALEDLDDLLKDVKRDLKDITIDYNPFMDLFEAWEHEWDYYYNIKQLIAQLGQQGQWIDNIISADYTSAEEKMAAYDAKIGNITAKMAANDAYILTLRQGITQNALELEKKFGQYYNVDNIMGSWQVYQKDTNLHEWNDIANAIKKTSYELSKVINQQENELNLLETTQDALEQERSAYESILSTVDSVIDSLENNEDISVDLSELKNVKAELEIAIKDESVEDIKEQIRNLNDYIQELEWQLDLNDNVVLKGIDDAVEDMEELRDKVQDYIDAMNEAIAEQQELIGQLSEVYNYYIDTAISTEQELYNAIVENYQNEINQKKKQYDYLKQLDNDYLNSIKNNISKERQAREDANKQKSYQQNIQRAQLLQMDTSGAYRAELANLNKEIEGQRQDLYDDLVDKQVEALEKEIEKRHELYDMEVAALEERLAYMQENAILLWEMVNQIVADGSETMMATLENTIDYINSNELARERQRKQWELAIQTTYKGVIDREIENLNIRIQKGNEYIKSIEEIKAALENNTETYQQSTTLLIEENEDFQSVMDSYMQSWTDMTNGMTGYYQNWQITVNQVKIAIERDIEELMALGEEGGGIEELDQKLRQSAKDMYNSFIEERKSYKDQLTRIIQEIETKISAAVQKAANAITNAAGNIRVNSNSTNSSSGGTNPGSSTNSSSGGTNPGSGGSGYKGWTAWFTLKNYYGDGRDYTYQDRTNFTNASYEKLYQSWAKTLEDMRKKYPGSTSWGFTVFEKGGFADFTGPAWLDGTKTNPEAILNPKQTKLFESMVSSLERASNNSNINSSFGSSYNVGDINTSINVAKLDNQTDIDKVAKAVEDKIVKTIRNRVSISINKGV